jgi:TolB-like protein/tetratricopeptide (TPR) repeat protein
MLGRAAQGAMDAMSAEDREPALSQASIPAGAVFLSYASQDADAAERLATALRSGGIHVWFDKSELRGGDAWDRQIRQQIHDCRLFIAMISAHTEARDEGYFRREWKLAVDRTHDMSEGKAFLVPVVIDDTKDSRADVPDRFRELQWTRLPGGETSPTFVERVRRLLSPEAPSARAATPGSPTPTTMRPPVAQRWWPKSAPWVTGAVLAVALAAIGVDRFLVSRRSPPPTPPAAPGTQTTAPAPATPATFNPPPHSIAVLPFVDMSEKKDQAYFGDGMAEEILNLLAKIPELTVIGRTSSFQFSGKTDDLRKIGMTLGAAYVVEGSVRRSADHVRVTAQLIDTRDGAHRWSDTYDAQFDDVLKVQDAIAGSLARALQIEVGDVEIPARPTVNPAAYDLFLKGMRAFDTKTQEGCEQAVGFFHQSLRLDPTFAPAAVGTAWTYEFMGEQAWLPTSKEAFERARESALHALELDPKLGAAHTVLANVRLVYDWDWAGAQQEIDKAFALGGRDAAALSVAARIISATAPSSPTVVSLLHEAIALDPLNAEAHMVLGELVYSRTGHFVEGERSIRRALQIDPQFGSGRYALAITLLMQGRVDEALVEARQETEVDGQLEGSAAIYHAQHRNADSDAAMAKSVATNANTWASAIARAYAFRGESSTAMKWLDRAYAQRDEDLYFIKGDPQLRSLEGDTRYKAFLRKMNLPE